MEQVQREALIRHGYNPDALPCGVSSKTGSTETWQGVTSSAADVYNVTLRYRVCELDGIVIDGHEASDLDPASTSCIHCSYEGPNP